MGRGNRSVHHDGNIEGDHFRREPVPTVSRARRAAAASALTLGALVLAACSGGTPSTETAQAYLPDLSAEGYTAFECGTGDAIGEFFQAPADEAYVAQCWRGTPGESFVDVANHLQDNLALHELAFDGTSTYCPEDVLGDVGGIACRVVVVDDGGDQTLIRTVVILSDIEGVLANLSDDPTDQEVADALTTAPVEVLVGTEPVPEV